MLPPSSPAAASAVRPHWSTIDVAGHACRVYEPPDRRAGCAVVYLHDVDERSPPSSTGLLEALEEARLPVIVPLTGRSWWLDRTMPCFDAALTPERFVVDHVRREAERRFGTGPRAIALAGVGMGGQGALRIAYRHPTVFAVAAAIAPAIDFHTAMREIDIRPDGDRYDTLWETYGDVERARQDTAILHVHPLNWPRHQWFASDPSDVHWHDGAARLESKLRALGIPHTARLALHVPATDDDDRHRMASVDAMATELVGFIVAAVDEESRRLV